MIIKSGYYTYRCYNLSDAKPGDYLFARLNARLNSKDKFGLTGNTTGKKARFIHDDSDFFIMPCSDTDPCLSFRFGIIESIENNIAIILDQFNNKIEINPLSDEIIKISKNI